MRRLLLISVLISLIPGCYKGTERDTDIIGYRETDVVPAFKIIYGVNKDIIPEYKNKPGSLAVYECPGFDFDNSSFICVADGCGVSEDGDTVLVTKKVDENKEILMLYKKTGDSWLDKVLDFPIPNESELRGGFALSPDGTWALGTFYKPLCLREINDHLYKYPETLFYYLDLKTFSYEIVDVVGSGENLVVVDISEKFVLVQKLEDVISQGVPTMRPKTVYAYELPIEKNKREFVLYNERLLDGFVWDAYNNEAEYIVLLIKDGRTVCKSYANEGEKVEEVFSADFEFIKNGYGENGELVIGVRESDEEGKYIGYFIDTIRKEYMKIPFEMEQELFDNMGLGTVHVVRR